MIFPYEHFSFLLFLLDHISSAKAYDPQRYNSILNDETPEEKTITSKLVSADEQRRQWFFQEFSKNQQKENVYWKVELQPRLVTKPPIDRHPHQQESYTSQVSRPVEPTEVGVSKNPNSQFQYTPLPGAVWKEGDAGGFWSYQALPNGLNTKGSNSYENENCVPPFCLPSRCQSTGNRLNGQACNSPNIHHHHHHHYYPGTNNREKQCPEGFIMEIQNDKEVVCVEKREFTTTPSMNVCSPPCENNGLCHNATCYCTEGYFGPRCLILESKLCVKKYQLQCSLGCTLSPFGKFLCICENLGESQCITIINTDNEKSCNPPCKNGGVCQDSKCYCPSHYVGEICEQQISPCMPEAIGARSCQQICIPGNSSVLFKDYTCACREGFALQLDGRTCVPIPPRCHPQCQNGGTCSRNGTCHCSKGYYGTACEEVNYCETHEPCDQICEPFRGSYICRCRSGFRLDSSGRRCVSNEICDHCRFGTCRNGKCHCHPGYQGASCDQDVNECQEGQVCHHICVNTPGSYSCECRMGFHLSEDGKMCQPDVCKCQHGHCLTNGSCQCDPGWSGRLCEEDLDECSLRQHECPQLCINTEGSFRCECFGGYELVSRNNISTCQPTVDCRIYGICANGGVCSSQTGKCHCSAGYTGNLCQSDVDECKEWPMTRHGCHFMCQNRIGSYECICPPGQQRLSDRKTCKAAYPDNNCNPACKNGGVCRSGKQCFCPTGFEGRDCSKDIDECQRYRPCDKRYGTCTNRHGYYECTCSPPHALMFNGRGCIIPDGNNSHLLWKGRGTKGVVIPRT